MPSLNKCQFIGRLGADPEMRYTPSGAPVTQFSLAVDHNRKVGDEWQQQTTWVRCIAWAQLAERTAEYFRKGRLVYAEGRLQIRKYTGQDGSPRYATEVVLNHAFALDRIDTDEPDAGNGRLVEEAHRIFGDDIKAPAATATGGDDLDDLPF